MIKKNPNLNLQPHLPGANEVPSLYSVENQSSFIEAGID